MAPAAMDVPHQPSSAPLADYFFIAGIETDRIFDGRPLSNGWSSPSLDPTLEEPGPAEPTTPTKTLSNDSPAKRRSKRFSYEARKSIGSMSGLEKGSASNRSSATIRPVKENGSTPAQEMADEGGFDEALRKFAADRDSVLAEIQFSAGQVAQPSKPPPRPRPKTQRIVTPEEGQLQKSPMGSVRRRLSTMNPLSRSSTSRRTSSRMSKRMSGYNSTIPRPQRFSTDANMHPLKRPYEPVLLDRYPSKDMPDESHRRTAFPDYVPMFVFPNDVNVLSADERPKSTWHGFAMTQGDGSKLYGITLIIWLPLNPDAAEELERQCESWRRRNMSSEERELANSLGERLAAERAHLSELLAQLPQFASDTPERESKEEEIGAVEEKIGLMTDMLRPVRHGAASKIEGLTDGETGLWVPRAYGVLGRDISLTGFWKEWLRAAAIPMFNGGIMRVPPSSPKVGMWQPLERYVVNLCAEALSPITSITQVELAVRELRLYARKEAINEVPGSRNTDLYPLFRSLDIPDIVVLFEYVLSESRIILLSSHTSMLHLVASAITQLLYPFKWCGIYIPVLPARLIQALEAPCPYIVGIERRYENVELPEDDFVLVDLDQGIIEATSPPVSLPRQHRRKLISILQLAAPHRYRFGVPNGTPKYAAEAYPFDAFCSENPSIFNSIAPPSTLAQLAGLNSSSFGTNFVPASSRQPLFNAFQSPSRHASSHSVERPSTSSTGKSFSNTTGSSPNSPSYPPSSYPHGTMSRNDSGMALQATLREKRSGFFETARRNSSVLKKHLKPSSPPSDADSEKFALDRKSTVRRPSFPTAGPPGHLGHASTTSISTMNTDFGARSTYAPSVYAQSTLAASTVMPNMLMQPVHNTDTTQWLEGHCMQWQAAERRATCSVCGDKADDGAFKCTGCSIAVHNRCVHQICLVCPAAFHGDQVVAAFARCFASLLYTYRKFLVPAPRDQQKHGFFYKFNTTGFMRSLPHDSVDYMSVLSETQAFNEFTHERETKRPDDPAVKLFDEIILSKRNRGRTSFFSKSHVNFLSDNTDHLWRSAAATSSSSRQTSGSQHAVGRTPAKLDPSLLKEPRVVQGVPRVTTAKPRRKQVPSMLGPGMRTKSEPSVTQ